MCSKRHTANDHSPASATAQYNTSCRQTAARAEQQQRFDKLQLPVFTPPPATHSMTTHTCITGQLKSKNWHNGLLQPPVDSKQLRTSCWQQQSSSSSITPVWRRATSCWSSRRVVVQATAMHTGGNPHAAPGGAAQLATAGPAGGAAVGCPGPDTTGQGNSQQHYRQQQLQQQHATQCSAVHLIEQPTPNRW